VLISGKAEEFLQLPRHNCLPLLMQYDQLAPGRPRKVMVSELSNFMDLGLTMIATPAAKLGQLDGKVGAVWVMQPTGRQPAAVVGMSFPNTSGVPSSGNNVNAHDAHNIFAAAGSIDSEHILMRGLTSEDIMKIYEEAGNDTPSSPELLLLRSNRLAQARASKKGNSGSWILVPSFVMTSTMMCRTQGLLILMKKISWCTVIMSMITLSSATEQCC